MTEPKNLLDHVAFVACDIGFGHCHIVGVNGEVVKNADIEKAEVFTIVANWEFVELILFEIPGADEAATWLYMRCDDQGEAHSEAVQFVSKKPAGIRSMQVMRLQ